MAWQTPKTNWIPSDAPTSSDFNKIEGNINYIEEESRTPSQTETPAGSGKLSVLLNYIATMIKSITGKTNWYNTPDTTLAAAKSHMDASAPHSGHETPLGAQAKVNTHANTHIGHGYYGAASGSANAYSVTLSPAPSGYVAGMFVAVKINVTNTGSSTINVNGLGAKTIKKPNGSNVSSGNLVINSIYSLRYNGTNFILQGEGSEGNAVAGDVLSGKTFSNSTQIGLTGTMPDRSGNTAALSSAISGNTLRLRASHGYRDGTNDFVTIADNDWIESNIRAGKNLFGKVGTLVEGSINVENIPSSTNWDGTGFTPAITVLNVSGSGYLLGLYNENLNFSAGRVKIIIDGVAIGDTDWTISNIDEKVFVAMPLRFKSYLRIYGGDDLRPPKVLYSLN